jgi:serine/threonine-protein kinase
MSDEEEPSAPSTMSFSQAAHIDELCDRFEAEWGAGLRPSIAQFLQGAPESVRTVLLRELLLVDLACRRLHGERPRADDYLEQFPGETELVASAFNEAETTLCRRAGDEPTAAVADHGPDTAIGDGSGSPGVRYKILRRHARGGLGEVFVAHEEDLKREVALKQIRPEYSGDTLSQLRFLREAEITGGLGHPGIVPIYGLGRHPDGRPFYVMPFIRGHSLDEAIKRLHGAGGPRDPGTRAVEFRKLLSHFLDVCNAIDYAHSQKVIHRDLKPSNIMLGPFGETLVVDWGLAKVLDAPAERERPECDVSRAGPDREKVDTLPGSPLGTPQYMSPEQASGRLELLGPWSDVYSLGAILYCLLTGRAPFVEKELPRLLRRVQEGDFEPPRVLDRSIARPLEAVCLKAMARQPGDRYAGARALADDLERWLADEPVTVYHEPWTTRLARWGRRHKPVVTGAAVLLVTTVVALTVSTILIGKEKLREESQRKRAELNFARAREAVDQMLSEVGETELAEIPHMEAARKRLLERALHFYQAFVAERGEDPAIRLELGRAQLRLGAIQGLLGNAREAEEAHRQAIGLFQDLARSGSLADLVGPDLARAYQGLAILLKRSNRFQESEAMFRTTVDLRERLTAAHPGLPKSQQDLAESRYQLATLLARLPHRQPEDERTYREAVELQASLVSDARARPDGRIKLVRYLNNLGLLLAEAGRLQEAESHYREAVKILEEELEREPTAPVSRWQLARSEANLGVLLQNLRRFEEAWGCLQRALARQQQLAGDFPKIPDYRQELASIHNNLGLLYTAANKLSLATAAFRESLALREQLSADVPETPEYREKVAVTRVNLALALEPAGPLAAKQAYLAALELQQSLVTGYPRVPEYRLALGRTLYSLAGLDFKQGELGEARRLLERAIPHHRAALEFNGRSQTSRDFLRDDYGVLTVILVRLKDHEEAARAALELPRLIPDQPIEYARAAEFLARCVELATEDAHLAESDRGRCAEEYGGRAVALLRQGFQAGLLKAPSLLDKPELRVLRDRQDFQRLRSDWRRAAKIGVG